MTTEYTEYWLVDSTNDACMYGPYLTKSGAKAALTQRTGRDDKLYYQNIVNNKFIGYIIVSKKNVIIREMKVTKVFVADHLIM